jgi:hypothetical protein
VRPILYRGVGEAMFRAPTVELRGGARTKRKESIKTITLLRVIIYCLKSW